MDLRWPIIVIVAVVTGLVEWVFSGRYIFDPKSAISDTLISILVVTAIAGLFVLRVPRERRGRPMAYCWAFVVLLLYASNTIAGTHASRYGRIGEPVRPAASAAIEKKIAKLYVTLHIDRSPNAVGAASRIWAIEGWQIYRQTTPDGGCFALGNDDETWVKFALTQAAGLGYVLIANHRWTRLKDQTYPMTIQFDRRRGWMLDGRGEVDRRGPVTFMIGMPFDDTAFVKDFLKGGYMTVLHGGTDIAWFDLPPAVGRALLLCQKGLPSVAS